MTFKKMERRTFLKQSGILASATLFAPVLACSSHSAKYKMGLQLFTIRDAMERDPLGSLKAVAEMGYEDFEIYGFDPETLGYYGYKAGEFKTILDDLGLSASSGHYGLSEFMDDPEGMKRYVDRSIEGAMVLGTPYITWPWMPPEARNLESFKRLPDILNRIGEQVNAAGLGFAYHNHNFEFEDFGGIAGYDIVMQETDPKLVKLQLDLYWAMHSSKLSPAELIARDPQRFVMWHIKDMDKVTRDYTELGNGSIDYHVLLSALSQEGLEYYYIEQGGNFAQNSMQSVKDSANYFKKELKGYLA